MMLIITTVATALYRFELAELLFPVSEYVWLDAAQFANFSNREITFGRNRGQRLFRRVFRIVFHYRKAPLHPSVSGWHGMLRLVVQ